MSLHDTIHLGAVGLTALAVCMHPGWRRRAASLQLAAGILMLAAMVDVAFADRVGVVLWTPLLLAVAIGMAAAGSVRRHAVQTRTHNGVWVTTHEPLGLVATAALLPLMHVGSVTAGDHSGHGVPPTALIAVVLLVAIGHVVGSVLACVRGTGPASRLRFAVMGTATSLMALSAAT